MDKTHNENQHLYWEQQPDGRWITVDPSCDPEADRNMQDLAHLLTRINMALQETERGKRGKSRNRRK